MKRFVTVASFLLVFLLFAGYAMAPQTANKTERTDKAPNTYSTVSLTNKAEKRSPADLSDEEWDRLLAYMSLYMKDPDTLAAVLPGQYMSTVTYSMGTRMTLDDGHTFLATVIEFDPASFDLDDSALEEIAEFYVTRLSELFVGYYGEEPDWDTESTYGTVSDTYDIFVHFSFKREVKDPVHLFKSYIAPKGEKVMEDITKDGLDD